MPVPDVTPGDRARVIDFLVSIGIDVISRQGSSGFVPHARIEAGRIFVDERCSIGDILHEAGHLAIVPHRWRHLCDDDLNIVFERMGADLREEGVDPDSAIYRAVIQAGENEAIAWAWAAGLHLGIAPEVIIDDGPEFYDGSGASIRLGLSLNQGFGIHGLAHAGFCSTNGLGGKPVYPKLAFWTQEAT